jgi:hypothetical protein
LQNISYVGNNPLKYRDPTGHVKETPEQEAMEEGAVGGVSDIMTGKTEAGQRTTIDKNTPSIDSRNDSSATIGVVVLVTKGLGFVI